MLLFSSKNENNFFHVSHFGKIKKKQKKKKSDFDVQFSSFSSQMFSYFHVPGKEEKKNNNVERIRK